MAEGQFSSLSLALCHSHGTHPKDLENGMLQELNHGLAMPEGVW